jgi:hypothetical protein
MHNEKYLKKGEKEKECALKRSPHEVNLIQHESCLKE